MLRRRQRSRSTHPRSPRASLRSGRSSCSRALSAANAPAYASELLAVRSAVQAVAPGDGSRRLRRRRRCSDGEPERARGGAAREWRPGACGRRDRAARRRDDGEGLVDAAEREGDRRGIRGTGAGRTSKQPVGTGFPLPARHARGDHLRADAWRRSSSTTPTGSEPRRGRRRPAWHRSLSGPRRARPATTLGFPTALTSNAPAQVTLGCGRDCLYLAVLERADGTPVVATRGIARGRRARRRSSRSPVRRSPRAPTPSRCRSSRRWIRARSRKRRARRSSSADATFSRVSQ